MTITRKLSTRARLERLEENLETKRSTQHGMAIIEMVDWNDGERHVVLVDAAHWHFREVPGPGPQLADFGEFSPVVRMTSAEMEVEVCEDSNDLSRDAL